MSKCLNKRHLILVTIPLPTFIYIYIYIYIKAKKNTQLPRGFDSESQESIKSLYHQRAIFSVTDLA